MLGYELEAFILNHRAAEMLPDDLSHLHRFRLSDHLTLVPVTRQLLKEVVAKARRVLPGVRRAGFM